MTADLRLLSGPHRITTYNVRLPEWWEESDRNAWEYLTDEDTEKILRDFADDGVEIKDLSGVRCVGIDGGCPCLR